MVFLESNAAPWDSADGIFRVHSVRGFLEQFLGAFAGELFSAHENRSFDVVVLGERCHLGG